MSARLKFSKGDRVAVTALGIQRHIGSDDTRGTVVGFSTLNHDCVRILRDHRKFPDTYHKDFWFIVGVTA